MRYVCSNLLLWALDPVVADIGSPANIARESTRTYVAGLNMRADRRAAATLESETARIESKLCQRFGFARRAYSVGATLHTAVALCVATIGYSLAAIGGVL